MISCMIFVATLSQGPLGKPKCQSTPIGSQLDNCTKHSLAPKETMVNRSVTWRPAPLMTATSHAVRQQLHQSPVQSIGWLPSSTCHCTHLQCVTTKYAYGPHFATAANSTTRMAHAALLHHVMSPMHCFLFRFICDSTTYSYSGLASWSFSHLLHLSASLLVTEGKQTACRTAVAAAAGARPALLGGLLSRRLCNLPLSASNRS